MPLPSKKLSYFPHQKSHASQRQKQNPKHISLKHHIRKEKEAKKPVLVMACTQSNQPAFRLFHRQPPLN
jgi:hypothetical protein